MAFKNKNFVFSIGANAKNIACLAWGQPPLNWPGWEKLLFLQGERETIWRALPKAFEWAFDKKGADSAVFISISHLDDRLLAQATTWAEKGPSLLLGKKSWGGQELSLELCGLRRNAGSLDRLRQILMQGENESPRRRQRQLELALNGLTDCQQFPLTPRPLLSTWRHQHYDDGTLIREEHRQNYQNHAQLRQAIGDNPFRSPRPFLETQARPQDLGLPLITLEMSKIWDSRPDLQKAFENPYAADRLSFCQWYLNHAENEYEVTQAQLSAVRRSLSQSGLAVLLRAWLKSTWKRLRQRPVAAPPQKQLSYAAGRQSGGLNLAGFSRAEVGLGESLRLAAVSLEEARIPFGILHQSLGEKARSQDLSWVHKEISAPLYRCNLIHLNPPYSRHLLHNPHPGFSVGRYNIGYWYWELPRLPEEWKDSFKMLHELWAPSRFVAGALLEDSPIPVRLMPLGLKVQPDPTLSRQRFGLPPQDYLFLFMYDVNSYAQRKNPEGVLEAFQRAFQPESKGVGLVMKLNHSSDIPEEAAAMRERLKEWKNIHILTETLTRPEVSSLQALCDCFVSLHRAEGFGLGPAECLALGKPVISTRYSATEDFIREGSACPVDSKLIEVGTQAGPYEADQVWADPDLNQAADYMRKLFQDRDWGRKIGTAGAALMAKEYSHAASGARMKARLLELGLF